MRFRSKKHLWWYAIGACSVVFLHVIGVLQPLERRVIALGDVPVTVLANGVQNLTTSFRAWRNKRSDAAALPEVSRERDVLKTRVALVEAENASLRRELQYPARSAWQTIGAEVIGKTVDIGQQAVIINRGSRDGIKPHQIVFAEQGVLVGEIISAENDRSVVRLINDRQSRVGVILAKNARPAGIAEGGYGFGVRLSLIPPQEVVEAGDIVVTNDSTEFMPRGLIVGRATSVGRETYEPFQHALIESSIGFDEMRHVSIIIKK
jgi:rod shape-determining protein MreC